MAKVSCITEEGVTYNEMVQILKKKYDGYHFTERLVSIYNPFSLFNTFDEKKLQAIGLQAKRLNSLPKYWNKSVLKSKH